MMEILSFAACVLLSLSFCYVGLAVVGVLRFGIKLEAPPLSDGTAPVTMLKPLCGLEPGLAENLRTFCAQDYENFQIVFGVRDRDDPAIPIINGIIGEFPDHDISLVVDDRIIGTNYKISNLANMMAVAKHDIVVISDSDMRVRPDYLRIVTAPFADGTVGATTCLYSGSTGGGMPSKLGALFINDWFFPSALLPTMFGSLNYCFGATMAVRRDVLEQVGGFDALADYLADDYMLGQFVVEQGYRIALAPYVVENVIHEPDMRGLFQHELRWARTIRSVQPVGYSLSFVTELLPLSLIAALPVYFYTGSAAPALAIIVSAFAMRVALHYSVSVSVPGGTLFVPWLIPVRDLVSVAVRIVSYFSSKVLWRESAFEIHANNQLKIAE
jgi:ceramide glucosyltransferase